MLDKEEAEEIYNKLQYYNADQIGKPWWQLTTNEQNYFMWLFEQPKYKQDKI